METRNELITKLGTIVKRIEIIESLINNQNEKLKEQNKILETLYKQLYGKEKKIQDLERSKAEKCRNNK